MATSTSKAEFVAICTACEEAVWFLRIVFLVLKREWDLERMRIVGDSQSAIQMSNTEVVDRRIKHIDISYHNVRDVVSKKVFFVEYTPSQKMLAEYLTKSLRRIAFLSHPSSYGLLKKG